MGILYSFPRVFSWGLAFEGPPTDAERLAFSQTMAVQVMGWAMPWPPDREYTEAHRHAVARLRAAGKDVWIWLVPRDGVSLPQTPEALGRLREGVTRWFVFLSPARTHGPSLPPWADGMLALAPEETRSFRAFSRRGRGPWRWALQWLRRYPERLWGVWPTRAFPTTPSPCLGPASRSPFNQGWLVHLFRRLSRDAQRFWLLEPMPVPEHDAAENLVRVLLQLWHVLNLSTLGVTAFFLHAEGRSAQVLGLYTEVVARRGLDRESVGRWVPAALPWLYEGLPYEAPEFRHRIGATVANAV